MNSRNKRKEKELFTLFLSLSSGLCCSSPASTQLLTHSPQREEPPWLLRGRGTALLAASGGRRWGEEQPLPPSDGCCARDRCSLLHCSLSTGSLVHPAELNPPPQAQTSFLNSWANISNSQLNLFLWGYITET